MVKDNPNIGLLQRAKRAGLPPAEQCRRETWAHDTGYRHAMDGGQKFEWLYSDPTGYLEERFRAGFDLGKRILGIQNKIFDLPPADSDEDRFRAWDDVWVTNGRTR